MYQLIHPSSFFTGLFAFRPFKILSGVMATLICSAGHDRPSRACSAPSSMPNDLKYKAIVAESCRGVQVETLFLLWELIHSYHRIHECCQSCLLRGCQAIPFIQHLTLCGGQCHTNVVLCKELRQCNTESIADLLKRCKRWRHRFFIPRGDGRLWQARAFSKLIFRPSPRLTILLDDFKNICHNFTTLDFSFIILWKIVAF